MNKFFLLLLILLIIPSQVLSELPKERSKAKNIILFVGDAMGISTVSAARMLKGQITGKRENDFLSFENFPNTAFVKTYSANNLVTDSAASMTEIVSGVKTNNNYLGVDVRGKKLRTLCDLAVEAKMKVGVVTNTRLTHATPAACFAGTTNRGEESLIAQQMLNYEGLNLMFGGGKKFISDNLISEWKKRTKGQFVRNINKLDSLIKENILGVFAESHLSYEQERPEGEPSLSLMTDFALKSLKNSNGFLLIVEGGRIDHAHHINDAKYALYETIEFAKAVERTVEQIDLEETLIVVTADHGQQISIMGHAPTGSDILGYTFDEFTGEKTQTRIINYFSGPGGKFNSLYQIPSAKHTGEDVPLYSIGVGSSLFRGVLEQGDIFKFILQATKLSN